MLILPAIDLRGGQCVRLRQGDYARETSFGQDPAEIARRWVSQGARYLHVVDLDGAKVGRPVNSESIRAIIQAAGVPCQLGGGLREDSDVAEVLSWGVSRVILGTRALKHPDKFDRLCRRYPQQVVLGLDARNGQVATDGWLEVSSQPAVEFAKQFERLPLAAIVSTDIQQDGMLAGPNLESLRQLAAAVTLPLIASGGISSLEDVRSVARLGLAGCIIGRALYEGLIDLAEAIRITDEQDH